MNLTTLMCACLGLSACFFLTLGCTRDSTSPSVLENDSRGNAVENIDTTIASAAGRNVSFSDQTGPSGVNHVYQNGEDSNQYAYVEMVGGGVGAFDYDLDGNADIIFPGGGIVDLNRPLSGHSATLWRATGAWGFQEVGGLAGVNDRSLYTHGIAIADYNSDGFPDVLITGYGGIQLFRNCGDGTFVSCARDVGMVSSSWSTSAGWADLDNDGFVDLFVTNYVNWSWDNSPICAGPAPANRDICAPQAFDGLKDTVFWNNIDGTFIKARESIGLADDGKGLGNILVDVDHDSRADLYVANDTTNNFLYMNLGERRLRESGIVSGTAFDHLGVPNGSMGIAVFDYDRDLKPDIFVTNYERESMAIYQNVGSGNFRCISERTGITSLGSTFVGFGAVSGDFNCDGNEDLVIANGHVMRHSAAGNKKQTPLFISNVGHGRLARIEFDDITQSYFTERHLGRGVVAVDIDNDGQLDLVFSHTNSPAVLLKNTTTTRGSPLRLRLIGTRSNRDAIGARAVLQTSGGKYLRQVFGGGSYLSQGPYEMHWGIPENESPESIEIVWPDGTKQVLGDLIAGEHYTVIQE